MTTEELEAFRADVLAGCDIQRGKTLYRQVPVAIGSGRTQTEIDRDNLKQQLDGALQELDQHAELYNETLDELKKEIEYLKSKLK